MFLSFALLEEDKLAVKHKTLRSQNKNLSIHPLPFLLHTPSLGVYGSCRWQLSLKQQIAVDQSAAVNQRNVPERDLEDVRLLQGEDYIPLCHLTLPKSHLYLQKILYTYNFYTYKNK